MCNSAEQAGVDDLRNDVFISETDNLVICADTSALSLEETGKEIDNRSQLSSVEVNEAAANGIGVDLSHDTCEHFMKDMLISGEEIVKRVDQTREPSKTCIAMTTSFSEGKGIVKDEYKGVETKPMEIEALSSKTKSSRKEEVTLEEGALQEASTEHVGELVTSAGRSYVADGQTSSKAVESLNSPLVSSGNESAAKVAEELGIDPCRGAEKRQIRTNMVHPGDTVVEVIDHFVLEGLQVGFEGHSTVPYTEADRSMVVSSSDLNRHAKEQVLLDYDESLEWIEMRPAAAKQIAASSEESSNGTTQITMNSEETEDGTAVGSLETQNRPQQFEQMRQDTVVIAEQHVETSVPTTAMSSQEDAAEHDPRSFKEANEDNPNEIEQDGAIVSSMQVLDTDTAVLKRSSRPEFADFFGNARDSKPEKEIEEQEYLPAMAKLPIKKKLFMESPRSLRMLLFSEETALPTKKDEKYKKDGKSMEFSSKVVPAVESHGNENHMEHNYPAKWYENPDNGETSSNFSGPIAFSGVISYSGQFPYSGSTSHRSDSSTSTRSFAFPILASDWNSSPVKMGAPDPRYYKPRRKWRFCFCCRRSSTLFD